jgi:hypothetical protein
MTILSLLPDIDYELVNQQTNQQKKVKTQKQEADPDKRRYLYARLGISVVDFSDLCDQAFIDAQEHIHADAPSNLL